ncbi:cytochrome c-type biogenesis protein CcmH [Paenibacillus sp. P26]|nr:cytochrome c-type biogenesis protein CcmH [Paenibacillus sp. P26]
MPLALVGDTSTQAIVGSYTPPNTGTTWYTWGLEGFLVAGISGVALWRRLREVHKQ